MRRVDLLALWALLFSARAGAQVMPKYVEPPEGKPTLTGEAHPYGPKRSATVGGSEGAKTSTSAGGSEGAKTLTPARLEGSTVGEPGMPREGRVQVVWSPIAPVLGKTSEVSVTFSVLDPDGVPVKDAALQLSSSVGWFEELHSLNDGRYNAAYIPPPTRFPQVALCSVVDLKHPGISTLFSLPLTGITRFPIQSKPGLPIEFEVAGKTFGPFKVSEEGMAVVELEVPPGVVRARVISRREGQGKAGSLEQSMDLPAPSFPRVKLMPLLPMVADGARPVVVQIMVVDATGRPMTGAQVDLTAALGVVTPPVEQAEGLYRARYIPPRLLEPRIDTLIVRLSDGNVQQEDRVTVTLRPAAAPARSPAAPAPSVLPTGESPVAPPDRPLKPIEPASGASPPGSALTTPPSPCLEAPVALAANSELPVPVDPDDSASRSIPRQRPSRDGLAWSPGPGASFHLIFETPKPPPALGIHPGGRLYPLLAVGYYHFQQESLIANDTLPPGVQSASAPIMLGAGLGGEYWFTERLGVEMRFETGYYAIDTSSSMSGDLKELLTVEGRARYPIQIADIPLAVGGRLGTSEQDHPSYETQDGSLAYTTNHALPLWLAGVEVQAFPGERLELWSRYGLGFHLWRLGQVSQHVELGALYGLTRGLSVGLVGELWERHLSAIRISDGVTVATLSDLWLQLWGYLAFHF